MIYIYIYVETLQKRKDLSGRSVDVNWSCENLKVEPLGRVRGKYAIGGMVGEKPIRLG